MEIPEEDVLVPKSLPGFPGTVLSLSLRHLFAQLLLSFLRQAFIEHLLYAQPYAGCRGPVLTTMAVTVYGARQTPEQDDDRRGQELPKKESRAGRGWEVQENLS